MRILIRFIRVYTPFICTIMALLNGVLFMGGESELPIVYLMDVLAGNSIIVDLYLFATSMRMCVWYKLNLLCLLSVQTGGKTLPVLFKFGDTENPIYHQFTTHEELSDFYIKAMQFISDTLSAGWIMKDSINWSEYEECLKTI